YWQLYRRSCEALRKRPAGAGTSSSNRRRIQELFRSCCVKISEAAVARSFDSVRVVPHSFVSRLAAHDRRLWSTPYPVFVRFYLHRLAVCFATNRLDPTTRHARQQARGRLTLRPLRQQASHETAPRVSSRIPSGEAARRRSDLDR